MQRFIYFFIVFPWYKFKMNMGKYLVMALPIILLTIFLASINTLTTSISHFIDHKILPVVEKHELLINVADSLGEQSMYFNTSSNSVEEIDNKYSYFKPDEIEGIRKIDHVASAEPSLDAGMIHIETDSLVDNKHLAFTRLKGFSPETARHLEIENFEYTEDGVLPIMLGINSLHEFNDLFTEASSLDDKVRSELLEDYQKDASVIHELEEDVDVFELVGKEFELSVGQLKWQPLLYREAGDFQNTFSLIPQNSQEQLLQQYTEAINQYWDATKLQQGITLKAKVVGIDSLLNPGELSIPNQAISQIHYQLSAHLTQAQKQNVTIPTSELGQRFRGIVAEENGLRADGGYLYFVDLPNQSMDLPGIFIPGLYYQPNAITGEMKLMTPDEVRAITFPIDKVFVSVDQMENRAYAWNALFGAGYQSGTSSSMNYNVAVHFNHFIESTADSIAVVFMVVALITTFFLMLRIAKTSDYETGVARVLGATKGHVLLIYVGFFVQQLLSAIVVGAVIGYGIILLSAPLISSAIVAENQFKFEEISIAYGEQIELLPSDFHYIDLIALGSDLGVILAVSLAGLLAAALFAARVQPYSLVNNNRE